MSDNSPGSGPNPPNDPIDSPDGARPEGSPADLPTEPMPVEPPPTEPMPITGETPIDPGVEPTQAMPAAAGEPMYGTDPTVPIATGAAVGGAGAMPPGGNLPPGGTVPPGGPGDPPPPWYQRNGAVLGVVAGLLAVALLIILLVWVFGGDDDDDATGDTTVPTTVVTSTSVAASTVPPTTVPATTAPTTAPPTTVPPTTAPPTTAPPTTAPPTTQPPTTVATTTVAPTTTPTTTAPPVVPDGATSFEILQANPDQFSTLVSLIERVGLDADLSQPGQSFTILAPTNEAFAGVDLGGLNDQDVTDILLHHVVPQSLDSGAIFSTSGDLDTLNVPVVVDAGNRTVDGASIVIPDLPATGDPDGWVQGIDAVLMP